MLLQSLKGIDSMDVTMFKYLASKGKLYEFLVDIGIAPNREAVKKKLFQIMFGPSSFWSKQHEIFEETFPLVYERFTLLKGHSKGNKFKSYKRLPILLQAIEAHLILDVILPRIYREHPGIIAVSIHDSVMTSIMTNDIEIVRTIMDTELIKFVGCKPALKVENFSFHINKHLKHIINEAMDDNRRKKDRQYHYDAETLLIN